MKNNRQPLCAALGALLLASAAVALAQTPPVPNAMKVTSESFSDHGRMASLYAGDSAGCGGNGISPQVAWSSLPAGTKSVAVFLVDPDGGKGLGVSHWVAYNIPANRGQIKRGEGMASGPGITVGKNVAGALAYRGMCPPVGDLPHHYVLTVAATDVEPGALPAGLTRDELLKALAGHGLQSMSVVGLYSR
ncbi:MAG: YbhB/YbcL family Raf kinase inhibitor-like protein [Pseudomonadota bacterium]